MTLEGPRRPLKILQMCINQGKLLIINVQLLLTTSMISLSRGSVLKMFQDGNHFNDKISCDSKLKRIISLDSYPSTFIEHILLVCRYLVLCLYYNIVHSRQGMERSCNSTENSSNIPRTGKRCVWVLLENRSEMERFYWSDFFSVLAVTYGNNVHQLWTVCMSYNAVFFESGFLSSCADNFCFSILFVVVWWCIFASAFISQIKSWTL